MNKFKKIISIGIIAILLCPVVPAGAAASGHKVILGGTPFGLTMYTSGVLVVNVDESYDSPALIAGVQENDIITAADGEEISTNEQLHDIITSSYGEDIELSVTRGKSPISLSITPQMNDEGNYTAGMWVRDSTAGLGTVTYYDESSHSFGALGHGICDRDTGILLPLKSGKILGADITSVSKGTRGAAGGLNGTMTDESIGEITVNNAYGVYGKYENRPTGTKVECADISEVKNGKAYIYSTVDETGVQAYEVEIENVTPGEKNGRNMVIRVTDKELLDKTGGIVQGMSGSPIVQDGKLVGAVTHVFVNSPEKGYGIGIQNMLENYKKYGNY